jgi:uncharacterized membrane protein YphA (DoxX/SURF4 family)
LTSQKLNNVLTYLIALVWFVNGFFCKVLNLAPRHEQIVARILGNPHARLFTFLIGFAEIIMAIWIIARFKTKLNATLQIIVIVLMNSLEFIIAPNLLMWGKLNVIFAFIFVCLIYYNEFIVNNSIRSEHNNELF